MKLKRTISAFSMVIVLALSTQPGRAAETPSTPARPGARIYDPALATTPAAAMFGLKDKKINLIDVRARARFEQYHIAGALNIPLHAIQSKGYLKSKPIVLVNEGFVVSSLAETCRVLNKAGFKATILAGGLSAWKHKGGKLIGDPFAQNQMRQVTPLLFDREKASGSLLVIEASGPAGSPSRRLAPNARYLSLPENPKEIRKLKMTIKTAASDPFARLVIFTLTGKENDRIQRRLARAGIHEAFFMEGGLQAYEKHLQYIQMARRPAAERKATTGGCKRCVQNN
jgi:rhodanese-related sulfurtransferase